MGGNRQSEMGFDIDKHINKNFDYANHCSQPNSKLCAGVLVFNQEGEKVSETGSEASVGCLFAQMQSLSGCSDWQPHIRYLNRVFAELGDNCTERQEANTVASCF